MKRYYLIIVVFLVLFLTTGCEKSIVGKWKSTDTENQYYYIFNSDKTCSYEMDVARLDCTYEVDGEKLIILYKGNENTNTFEYRFDGKTLIIKDDTGKDNKFIKGK